MAKLVNTGIRARDPRRVYFLDPESGICFDLKPDWVEPYRIIETGLIGPNGVEAVRIIEEESGVISTVSAETAERSPRIRR